MTYVEKILRMQAEVAAELQPEADEALTVYHWSVGVRPEAGTQDAETEPGTAEAQSLPADMQTPEMQEIAKAHGVHPALIALKWAHQRGEISIPFSVHNYVSNLKCVTEDPLTEEEMAKIGTLERGNRLVKGQVFLWEGAKDWHDLWDEEGYIVK